MSEELEDAIDDIDAACEVCARHGKPLPSKKISLTHVNEAFNEEVQIDFTYIEMNGTKYTLIVITGTGTSYSECEIVDAKNVNTIMEAIDRLWICKHGTPKHGSADDEFNRAALRRFSVNHGIEFHPRPTRRHNKVGFVERKNGTIKNIVQRLANDNSTATPDTISSSATFLSNMFSGSRVLSSFQLVRGYQPSILGIPNSEVSQELLDAHKEQMATHAQQKVLRSRTPNTPTPDFFQPSDDVWVWYASSKNNEKDEWIRAQVVQTHKHYLEVRRYKDGNLCKGPTMKPAYEDVRIAPKGELTKELLSCSLEYELGYPSPYGGDSRTRTTSSRRHKHATYG